MPIDLGQPVSDHPLNQGLLHWWLGLPGLANGSRLEDIAGVAPATLTNGPTWDVDANNFPCLSFDGTNDYATCGDVNDVEGITALSISAYLYSTTLAGGTDGLRYIISKEDGGGLIWILRQLTGGDKLQWYCQTGVGTFGPQEVTGFTAGAWHHVTAAYQSGVGLDLYRNGVSSSSTGFATIGTLTTSAAPVSIGSLASTVGRAWSGFITDVRIVNRRVSQSEAWELYEQTLRGNPNTLRRYTNTAYFLPSSPVDLWECATSVGVTTAWHDVSPWDCSTTIVGTADAGGSIPSAPSPSSVWECGTVVGVPTADVLVSGQLFAGVGTGIGVSTSCAITAIWACATEVGVAASAAIAAGRNKFLAGGLYRR